MYATYRSDHSPSFTADLVEGATGTMLVLRGELDTAAEPQASLALSQVLAMTYESQLPAVLDHSELDGVGSGGIVLMRRARDLAERWGGRIILRSPTAGVRRVLQVAGLADSVDGDHASVGQPVTGDARLRAVGAPDPS